MKRKNLIFAVFAAIVAAAASCAKEQAETSGIAGGIQAGTPMTITAGLGTKIYYKAGKTICWTTEDKLRVFNDTSEGSTFTTQDGGESVAEFTCDNWAGGTPVFAVHSYPASLFEQFVYDGSKVTAYLRPAQEIVHKQSFSKYSILSVGTISKPEDSYVISEMKNVFGSIGFKIESSGVKSVTLTGNNNEDLAGWVDVDYNNGKPVWTASEVAGKAASKSIVATVSGGGAVDKETDLTFVPNTTYYINVLPQTFENGLTLKLENKDGAVLTRVIDKKIVIERSKKHSITTAIDTDLPFELIIDCTTVKSTTFKYDVAGVATNLPKRTSNPSTPTIPKGTDFWSASCPDYIFNGGVRFWDTDGGSLGFDKYSYIRFPRISDYKLAKITEFEVVHTSARGYMITAEPADTYADGVAVAGGEAKSLKKDSNPASFILTDEYDADKDYYIVCNGEAGIRFKLTYSYIKVAQE